MPIFSDFVRFAACRSGRMLNVHDAAQDAGASARTVRIGRQTFPVFPLVCEIDLCYYRKKSGNCKTSPITYREGGFAISGNFIQSSTLLHLEKYVAYTGKIDPVICIIQCPMDKMY